MSQHTIDAAIAQAAISEAVAALERLAAGHWREVDHAELEDLAQMERRIGRIVDTVARARSQLAQLHERASRRLAELRRREL